MSDKFINIDFSIGDNQLYYLYKITVTRNNENKIVIVDGNCLPREYAYSFINLEEQKAERPIIRNFICIGSKWPDDVKKLAIQDCEDCRNKCPFCSDDRYETVSFGGQCHNCGITKC